MRLPRQCVHWLAMTMGFCLSYLPGSVAEWEGQDPEGGEGQVSRERERERGKNSQLAWKLAELFKN